jgi:hypothetical protein
MSWAILRNFFEQTGVLGDIDAIGYAFLHQPDSCVDTSRSTSVIDSSAKIQQSFRDESHGVEA